MGKMIWYGYMGFLVLIMFMLSIMTIAIAKTGFVIVQTINTLKMFMVFTISTYHEYGLDTVFEKFLL